MGRRPARVRVEGSPEQRPILGGAVSYRHEAAAHHDRSLSAWEPGKARAKAKEILRKAGLGQDTRLELDTAKALSFDTLGKLAEAYIAKAVEGKRAAGYVRDVRRYLLADAKPSLSLPVEAC